MTLGRYPAITLADAREFYRKARNLTERGVDPQGGDGGQSGTVADLIDDYLKAWAEPRKRSAGEDRRILAMDVLPSLGVKPIVAVRRSDIRALVDGIVLRGAPVMANRTLACVRQMFNYALDRGLIESNPAFRLKPPGVETPKERFLKPEEIGPFWRRLASGEGVLMTPVIRWALLLVLATGKRPGEVAGMRLDELDAQRRWWTIPTERMKGKRRHRVPLTNLSRDLIAQALTARPARWNGVPHVFVARMSTWGHINPGAMAQAMKRNLGVLGLSADPATPHDLRRTCTTEGGRIGIPRVDRQRVLGHMSRDVTAVYDLYEYDNEKRRALEAWAQHLQALASETT